MSMRCVFLGTPSFALPAAEALHISDACELVGVITRPDEPVGRKQTLTPPAVAVWATERGLPLRQPKTKSEIMETLRELRPDIGVVVAYGKIIPAAALAIPHHGFVNIHPSLLPKYRGPSPIHTTLANGDTETGVTLMLLDADVDHGPILAQERVSIAPKSTRHALEGQLARVGAQLLVRTLPGYLANQIKPQNQDHASATFTKLLTRDDGQIDWNESADALERKIRAYEGWPGAWCQLANEKRLKIISGTIGAATDENPGMLLDDKNFRVSCGGKTSLILSRVQPEGSASMDGSAFLRGYHGPRQFPVNK